MDKVGTIFLVEVSLRHGTMINDIFHSSYTPAPEWAASGAKLGLALDVRFLTKECSYEMNQENILGGTSPSLLDVVPMNEPSFISAKGQEKVKVLAGAFSCQIQIQETQQYNLNFFMDFVSLVQLLRIAIIC